MVPVNTFIFSPTSLLYVLLHLHQHNTIDAGYNIARVPMLTSCCLLSSKYLGCIQCRTDAAISKCDTAFAFFKCIQ